MTRLEHIALLIALAASAAISVGLVCLAWRALS